ncbi:head-tail connector protein [Nitratireductor thuwali]|uniref:Phage gp6-like head-tail connector protein n=1 Tax=Nitratireductor thuwali TaxID=2267699 RepID=A0ABY5MLU5_9HYPH|nr:hypothetical protein NTH_03401 [Nitratireductor thuwali]
MTLFRTVAPAAEPLTLAEAKAHMRVAHAVEDDLIAGLIRAAREEVERATGLALINQSWRLVLDGWPKGGTVLFRRGPVREVLSVTVFGADGGASLIAAETYQADTISDPARLHLEDRPPPGTALNGIEIDFTAGYGEAGTDVPDLLKRALLMLVAHWYEFRGIYGADSQPVSLPESYLRLIAAHKGPRLR